VLNIKLDSIRDAIVQDFSKAWEINDEAHRFKHFSAVEVCANEINNRLGLEHEPVLILFSAFFHDMFAWSRFNHHLLSAEWIMTTDYDLVDTLTEHQRELVAAGCREHRASGKDPFTCQFAELMCAADRELPGNVPAMVERAVQYRMGKGDSFNAAVMPSIQHIKEKFGTGGYARYPKLYLDAFNDELAEQRKEIDNL